MSRQRGNRARRASPSFFRLSHPSNKLPDKQDWSYTARTYLIESSLGCGSRVEDAEDAVGFSETESLQACLGGHFHLDLCNHGYVYFFVYTRNKNILADKHVPSTQPLVL